jgi:hypothetical protein
MLFEVVYEAVEKALVKRGERDRFLMPAVLRDKDEAFFTQHSVAGVMTALMHDPDAMSILEWLEQDDVVKRHANNHPEIWEQLERFKDMANEARTLEVPLFSKAVGNTNISFR